MKLHRSVIISAGKRYLCLIKVYTTTFQLDNLLKISGDQRKDYGDERLLLV